MFKIEQQKVDKVGLSIYIYKILYIYILTVLHSLRFKVLSDSVEFFFYVYNSNNNNIFIINDCNTIECFHY